MDTFFLQIAQKLSEAKIENPQWETRLIFAEVLQKSPSEIFLTTSPTIAEIKKINHITEQRLRHKPLDKIFGHRGFYKYDFFISEDVLSPRPDTEILVESALEILPIISRPNILDLGCGSGCIIETLLKENPLASGCAVDISAQALSMAKKNAKALAIDKQLKFINADWFAEDFTLQIGKKFDMIVSNPPYIPSAEIETLTTEVKKYDPLEALDGGATGFESYERIAEIAPILLRNNGYILLEAGYNQARQIVDIFTTHGLNLLKIVNDLAGIERCVVLQLD